MNSDPTHRDSAPALPVAHEGSGTKGRYVVRLEGTEAEMTYTRAGQHLIIIDHTSVPDALRGVPGLHVARRTSHGARRT